MDAHICFKGYVYINNLWTNIQPTVKIMMFNDELHWLIMCERCKCSVHMNLLLIALFTYV